MQAVDADDLAVIGNVVTGHGNGIVLTGAIVGARVEDNQVSGAITAAIAVRDGPTGVAVGRNRIDGGLLGIQVRAARTEARSNTVEAATGHAVTLVGAVSGSTVADNILAGQGRSALDTARIDTDAVVTLDANDMTGWVVEIPLSERVTDIVRDHPLLPLWVVVLLLPVLLLAVRLRRRRRPARPYPEVAAPPDRTAETKLVPLAFRRPPRMSGSSAWPQTGTCSAAAARPGAGPAAAPRRRSPAVAPTAEPMDRSWPVMNRHVAVRAAALLLTALTVISCSSVAVPGNPEPTLGPGTASAVSTTPAPRGADTTCDGASVTDVSTADGLTAALAGARPDVVIRLAAGTYAGPLHGGGARHPQTSDHSVRSAGSGSGGRQHRGGRLHVAPRRCRSLARRRVLGPWRPEGRDGRPVELRDDRAPPDQRDR